MLALSFLMMSSVTGDLNPRPEPIKIMALGDSITQGVGRYWWRSKSKGGSSYRKQLQTLLNGQGYQFDFVGSQDRAWLYNGFESGFDPDHEGHFGWRIDEILNGREGGFKFGKAGRSGRLTRWLVHNVPDVTLLHLGTNDLFQNQC